MIPTLSPVAGAVSDATRPKLRPYQQELKNQIYNHWNDHQHSNVLAVLPTGAGKTVFFSSIIAEHAGATCAVAHRQELVSQISLALARNKVRHRIIGPTNVVKMIVRLHMEEVGHSYYDPNSRHAVAGVDTLVRRGDKLESWLPTVKLWVMDEAHHVLQENKWGKAVNMFPNARGMGVTATPSRADGCGLGSHADGVFDKMFIGPSMRDLINMGYLTDYKLYAPPSSFRRDAIKKVSQTTGDFVASEVSKAVNESSLVAHDEKQIVGDVVRTYQKLLNGMLTVVFAPDVATATELEKQYNDAGIPAKCVHGAMPDAERINAVRKFKNREYLVLTSVAIFDEGFDCPAIEAVQDVSATESFGRFVQRAGRMLRLKEGKDFGRYVDHVGNIERHAVLVDHPEGTKIELCHREWTLDRREKSGGKSEKPAVRACAACSGTYERYLKACPYCGEPIPEPASGQRSNVEWVDGDLHELDPDVLARLQGEVIGAREDVNQYRDKMIGHGLPPHAVKRNVKLHENRLDALVKLDHTLAQWAGYRRAEGLSDSEIFRKFYLTYGVSWLEAQALKAADADKLRERIGL
ncbi:helicase [Klebsiella phage vB_KleM_KB2]|jgi:superfamily II DNA or RNA helicase|uniref:Helicase n=1 Tax=Klebsiella phage vB_KleM_KB2 TaxID=2759197 RepID=A0AAE7M1X7_9CAUD|nr:DEAD/DEAH box helicase [Klebsiella phage vB_KleM_KB2]QNI20505.1 helicase [Klebsiella phage vB_KleM_KB2]DAE76734.1 MAG TPA: Type I site specific restriction modification protein [Caudoviricetes sp.]